MFEALVTLAITVALGTIGYLLKLAVFDRLRSLEAGLFGMSGRSADLSTQVAVNEAKMVVRKSPIALSEDGREAVQNTGLADYVTSHLGEFRPRFKQTEQADDIHYLALAIANDLAHKPNPQDQEFVEIRRRFYDQGISRSLMATMFAIQLRDEILKNQAVNTAPNTT